MTEYLLTKSSTAIHEICHALVQAVLDVGPEFVRIEHAEIGWIGRSQPFLDADSKEKLARLFVSQLAGPIGQGVIEPESLGEFRELFATGFLGSCISIYPKSNWSHPEGPLHRLCWEGDFTNDCLIDIAKPFQYAPPIKFCHEAGGYLFRAEEALTVCFKDQVLHEGVKYLASALMKDYSWSGESFRHRADELINSPAWAPLRSVDLAFITNITFR